MKNFLKHIYFHLIVFLIILQIFSVAFGILQALSLKGNESCNKNFSKKYYYLMPLHAPSCMIVSWLSEDVR
jgi:hypothetical protein